MKFDKIIELNVKSKNELFIGYKEDSKFFIKKYVVRKGREKDDLLKIKCEILCYKNLRKISLPRLIKSDFKNRILILEFVKYRDIKLSKEIIDKIINYYFNKILKIDASFLPEVKFDYYEKSLFKRAKKLSEMRIIYDVDKVIEQFKQNRKQINNFSKNFSHGDLHLGNFKYLDNKLTITDFEHARQDNEMYDLTAIFIDLFQRNILRDYFYSRIKNRKIFDEKLFNLMLIRRCIEVLYALKESKKSHHFMNAKNIINSLLLFQNN
jgi:thiamine kinase-like enzyme